MEDVRCFGCGAHYEPTPVESRRHTHHLGEVPDFVSRERLAAWLESCQAQRDEALRHVHHGRAQLRRRLTWRERLVGRRD